METFEVETDLIIHCRIKVRVQSDSREGAIDVAAAILPHNHDPESMKGWKATIALVPPKGVDVNAMVKGYHFEQGSGADKARRVKP